MSFTHAWVTDPVYDRGGNKEILLFSAHAPFVLDYYWSSSSALTDPNSTVAVTITSPSGSSLYTGTFTSYMYNTSGSGPYLYYFRMDFSEIIRHIISDLLYKEPSYLFHYVNLSSKMAATIHINDGASSQDTQAETFYFCHAMRQIGDVFGSAVGRWYLQQDDILRYFKGLPQTAFFWSTADVHTKFGRATVTNTAGGTFDADGSNPTLYRYLQLVRLNEILSFEKDDIRLDIKATDGTQFQKYLLSVVSVETLKQNRGLYVRFLDRDGSYTFWYFSQVYNRQVEGSHIGTMHKYFSKMENAQIGNYNLGYDSAYHPINAIAPGVSIEYRKKLQHIYLSPAVYVWLGCDMYGEELCLLWESDTDNAFGTFTPHGTEGITSAISDGSALARAFSIQTIRMRKNELFNFVGTITLNSGTAPRIAIYDVDRVTLISDYQQLSGGPNDVTLTSLEDSDNCVVAIYNPSGTAGNWSLASTTHQKKENEELWVLCERVEGSHDLLTKKGSDNVEATFYLPELFTQKFSIGQ